jgi:hypothetical protein
MGGSKAWAVFRFIGKYRVFLEKLVFRFCQSPSTEKPRKREEPGKNELKKANVSIRTII